MDESLVAQLRPNFLGKVRRHGAKQYKQPFKGRGGHTRREGIAAADFVALNLVEEFHVGRDGGVELKLIADVARYAARRIVKLTV